MLVALMKQNSLMICPTSNFDIDGYELFCVDRKKVGKNPGGGRALYISDNVNFDEKSELIP